MQGYQSGREYVFDELRRLDLLLNLQIALRRHDPAYTNFNEFRGLFITDEEIDLIVGTKNNKSESEARRRESEVSIIVPAIDQLEDRIAKRTMKAIEEGVRLSLPHLVQMFCLTPFDIGALVACLAPELDLKYEKLYAFLHNDVTRKRPSVGLIVNLFCQSFEDKLLARTRLIAEAPLLKYNLMLFADESPNRQPVLLSRLMKIDDRILNYLLDIDCMDEHLINFTNLIVPHVSLQDSVLPAKLKENLVRLFQSQVLSQIQTQKKGARVFLFEGPMGVGKKFTAEALCKSVGTSLLVADVSRMLFGDSTGQNLSPLIQRLLREARLRGSAVYLDHAETLLMENEKVAYAKQLLFKALEDFPGIAFVGSEHQWDSRMGPQVELFFRVAFPVLNYSSRKQLWQSLLMNNGHEVSREISLDDLAVKFKFTAMKIRNAISEAKYLNLMCNPDTDAISADALYQACRIQSSTKLSTLARKITPLYIWDDIILPNDCMAQLREVCNHVKYQQQVFGGWGFSRKLSLGKGLGILFVGPSGTGKTMAVEIIAGEVGLDLYKIDLSCVVSKYIGETEKNLSKIFQEAEHGNSILFFDEADAIFGKRSEVRDSHDRYANIEINYLLQKMEEYEGIVILASNFQKNIDEAFTRRLRFIVEFPMPDEAYRFRIWKGVFPEDTPLGDDIDFEFLARKFKIAGGNIKNIALGAAFLGAENSGVVNMEDIVRATKREFQKMGRLCVKVDFEQYFELVQNDGMLS